VRHPVSLSIRAAVVERPHAGQRPADWIAPSATVGIFHGAASVADSANGYAAYTLAPPDTDVLAVEFKINLMAPATGEGFLACAQLLRPGRTLTVCRADVFTTGTSERTLIATMLSTIILRSIER